MDYSVKTKTSLGKLKIILFLFFLICLVGVTVSAYMAFIDLPRVDNIKSCFTTKMYKVNLCSNNPNYIKYNQVPKSFIDALIASEDAAFWGHEGFDINEIKESFRKNFIEGKLVRGGSTITQQLAKNLYLSNEKSLVRKFRELFLAQKIEKVLAKKEILEKYINVVEFGENIFGLKQASQKYFSVTPQELNIAQSIYLVSLLPNPKSYGKSRYTKKLSKINTSRMRIIADRLQYYNKITEDELNYINELINGDFWNPISYELYMSQKQNPADDDNSENATEDAGTNNQEQFPSPAEEAHGENE